MHSGHRLLDRGGACSCPHSRSQQRRLPPLPTQAEELESERELPSPPEAFPDTEAPLLSLTGDEEVQLQLYDPYEDQVGLEQ